VIEPVFINSQKVQIVQTYILVSIWTVNWTGRKIVRLLLKRHNQDYFY